MRRRDRSDQSRQGERHDRHGSEVLHRADDAFAGIASRPKAFLFGQQEIPQAERGGRVVQHEPRQAPVALLDVARQ